MSTHTKRSTSRLSQPTQNSHSRQKTPPLRSSPTSSQRGHFARSHSRHRRNNLFSYDAAIAPAPPKTHLHTRTHAAPAHSSNISRVAHGCGAATAPCFASRETPTRASSSALHRPRHSRRAACRSHCSGPCYRSGPCYHGHGQALPLPRPACRASTTSPRRPCPPSLAA